MRKIKDAKDLSTNELIYFKGHAKATYMSDGRTVEESINSFKNNTINNNSDIYVCTFTVDDLLTNRCISQEQNDELVNAILSKKIITIPIISQDDWESYTFVNNAATQNDNLFLEFLHNDTIYHCDIMNLYIQTSSYYELNLYNTYQYKQVDNNGTVCIDYMDTYRKPNDTKFVVEGECEELQAHLDDTSKTYHIVFFTGETCSIEFQVDVLWLNGTIPTIEPYTQYELSLAPNTEGGFNAILTPFK